MREAHAPLEDRVVGHRHSVVLGEPLARRAHDGERTRRIGLLDPYRGEASCEGRIGLDGATPRAPLARGENPAAVVRERSQELAPHSVRRLRERVQVVDEQDRAVARAVASTASRRPLAASCHPPPARRRAGTSSWTGVSRSASGTPGLSQRDGPNESECARGLAHPGLPDHDRGALGPAQQDCRDRVHLALEADHRIDRPALRSRDEVLGAVLDPARKALRLLVPADGPRAWRGEGGRSDSIETRQAREQPRPLVPAAQDRLDPAKRGDRLLPVVLDGEGGRRAEQRLQGRAERREASRPATGLALEGESEGLLDGFVRDARPGEDPAKLGARRPVPHEGEENDFHADDGQSAPGRVVGRLPEHPLPGLVLALAELPCREEVHSPLLPLPD